MSIIVTGAAGFIGMSVSKTLLERGETVIGIDSFVPYYELSLKEARWQQLEAYSGFTGMRLDLAEDASYEKLRGLEGVTAVIHLAAQPGVRYAREHPASYIDANLRATTLLCDFMPRYMKGAKLVYASSSSVYGRNTKLPYSEDDAVERPASLYAATKRATELVADVYHYLHGIDMVGLRFFTVYGPWGRPDMAPWMFTKAVMEQTPITLFNGGQLRRDFTFIDDIVAGVIGSLDLPRGDAPQHRIYNLGNSSPVVVRDLVSMIEQEVGQKAIIIEAPVGADEVEATYADVSRAARDFGFAPRTSLADGIRKYVAWYRDYTGMTKAA